MIDYRSKTRPMRKLDKAERKLIVGRNVLEAVQLYIRNTLGAKAKKYESSPIFVRKLQIRLYLLDFSGAQINTSGPQTCRIGVQTSTLFFAIVCNIFSF